MEKQHTKHQNQRNVLELRILNGVESKWRAPAYFASNDKQTVRAQTNCTQEWLLAAFCGMCAHTTSGFTDCAKLVVLEWIAVFFRYWFYYGFSHIRRAAALRLSSCRF